MQLKESYLEIFRRFDWTVHKYLSVERCLNVDHRLDGIFFDRHKWWIGFRADAGCWFGRSGRRDLMLNGSFHAGSPTSPFRQGVIAVGASVVPFVMMISSELRMMLAISLCAENNRCYTDQTRVIKQSIPRSQPTPHHWPEGVKKKQAKTFSLHHHSPL